MLTSKVFNNMRPTLFILLFALTLAGSGCSLTERGAAAGAAAGAAIRSILTGEKSPSEAE